MPSLIDIRRRVRAVKSTQQITKAMKMVSSSKLRRAQERILRSRPYAKEMLRVFNNLATRTENATHPLLNDDPLAARTLLIVITADRGLCGSFNTNVVKSALQFTIDQPKSPDGRDVAMALVGRKGRDFFMRRGFDVLYEEVGLFQNVKWSHAQAIAQHGDQGIPRARHQLGLPGLQRVPVGDLAARRDRKAAADSAPQEAEAASTPPPASRRRAEALDDVAKARRIHRRHQRSTTCSSPTRSSC